MIWLRKVVTTHFKFFYGLLLCIYLIDAANLLSLVTKGQIFSLEEGELLAYIDQYQDQVSSPLTKGDPEPDQFENEQKKVGTFYDIDSPLIPYYCTIKDHSYLFFKIELSPLFFTFEFVEILYLKNCILLI